MSNKHIRSAWAWWLGAWLALSFVHHSGPVRADQPPAGPEAIELAPALPDAPRQPRARGVFFTRSQLLDLPGRPLHLASTPDGRGELCSDDQATISFQAGTRVVYRWSQRFTSADRQAITCIAPQPIALPAAAASYSVTIVLEDLYPDTYGSRAYYLVIDPPAPGAGGAADAPTPARPAVPTPTPTATSSAEPAVAATLPPDAPAGPMRPEPLIGLAAITLVLLAGAAWLITRGRRGRAGLRWAGIIDLFDTTTREARTITLQGNAPALAITRHPLRAAPADGRANPIALLRLTAQGPVIEAGQTPIALRHDQRYQLAGGMVVLRYRGEDRPRAATPTRKGGPG
jgi:hypothetical protein